MVKLITSSRVTAVLLNRLIFPIGGASALEGLQSMEPSPFSLCAYMSTAGKLPCLLFKGIISKTRLTQPTID